MALAQATGVDDFVVSDELSSLMIAQLAERPELQAVFDELSTRRAHPSLSPRPGVHERSPGTFADLVAAARARSHVALGYRLAGGDVILNPPKSAPANVGTDDCLIVLARSDS